MLPTLFNPTTRTDVNITTVEKALRARLLADTGSGGLFASGAALVNGCYNTRAPSNATPPYIVYTVLAAERVEGFELAMRTIGIDIDVYVPVESTTSALSDPINVGGQILDRLEGDWFVQSYPHNPTFGLNRHLLTLSGTTWTPDRLEGQTTVPSHTDEMYVWTDSYNLNISITAP